MKRVIGYILVFITCLIFSINGVKAKSYIKELFQAKETLEIKEELDGTSFLAGMKVNVENNIKGIAFIAGETTNLNGNMEYLVNASTTININQTIKNDAFIFTEEAKIKGNIGRDLYMFSNNLKIEGNIERNAYIYANKVDIKGTIKGNITINALEINIDDEAVIDGTLKYNENAVIKGINDNINTKTYKINEHKTSLKDYITGFINTYIHIAIVGLVLVFLMEKVLKNSLKQTKKLTAKTILSLTGKGLLFLIGLPLILMMLLMTGVFVSVGVIGLLLYGIMVYVSSIFTAYFIADIIDKKYIKKDMNSYILIIVGLLIINVLSIIPLIGPLISLISILVGLGIVGNMVLEVTKKN